MPPASFATADCPYEQDSQTDAEYSAESYIATEDVPRYGKDDEYNKHDIFLSLLAFFPDC